MSRRKNFDVQKVRSKILGFKLPYFVILSIWLILLSPLVSSTMFAAPLQLAIAQTTTPSKTTKGNAFLTYENNSTLGIKIQYPSKWKRVQYGDMAVVFVSPSERNSDKFLESFSIAGTPTNNKSISELASQSIANYRQKYANFQLIGTNVVTLKGSPAYMLKYEYTDQLFGKAMAMDIGMTKGGKLYVLSYSAEPAKFYIYVPTIQKMIDSFEIEGRNSNESRPNLSNSELT